MFKIDWVTQGIKSDANEQEYSALASNRYRAIIPARGLRSAGHLVRLQDAHRWELQRNDPPDVIILGKLLPFGDDAAFAALATRVREIAARASSAGIPVLADFNDDHFSNPTLGEHWRQTAALATVCVVGSEPMEHVLSRYSKAPIIVVGDPLGAPSDAPRVFRRPRSWQTWLGSRPRRMAFAWYGNPVNWPALEDWAKRLAPLGPEQPFVIWAVTQVSPEMEAFSTSFNVRHGPHALIELTPWDEHAQWSIVRDADAVLVPSRVADPRMTVKTSNRVADALHAGRYVFASPLPTYRIYADGATLTDEPLSAVREYLAQPDIHLARLEAGQALARQHSGPDVIAEAWLRAVQRAIDSASSPSKGTPGLSAIASTTLPERSDTSEPKPETSGESSSSIRLNLGCGDKILQGYVNVDVVPSRRGRAPDVLCDLRDLSVFASDSVEEVLAVHVVEHFWRWEVEDILREWVRVLRPGGRMVLECPNLITACEAFLRDPDVASREDQAGQRTMWVFYGDPAWKDPYMIHRWGYTPASLGRLMAAIGLTEVRQEPAVYKLREPRDMRMVGRKPSV